MSTDIYTRLQLASLTIPFRILAMTISSEIAAQRQDVKGPGSFISALIDELASITPEQIIELAKIEI